MLNRTISRLDQPPFERGEPNWPTLNLEAAAELPAVRWRQQNLDGLKAEKRQALVRQLEEVLAT